MTVYFDHALTREAEHEDAEDLEVTLHIGCRATGYCNRDVGGGGPTELDEWWIDDWYGDEPFELTSAEDELIGEAAQEALYDL